MVHNDIFITTFDAEGGYRHLDTDVSDYKCIMGSGAMGNGQCIMGDDNEHLYIV